LIIGRAGQMLNTRRRFADMLAAAPPFVDGQSPAARALRAAAASRRPSPREGQSVAVTSRR
jgi:hypothetical protein